jgi:hypothetical protein
MAACLARFAILILTFCVCTAAARADDLADFNAAVESAEAHNRVALGYLRTGNVDLAALEVERLRDTWGDVSARFAGNRPAVFKDTKLYVTIMTDIAMQLVAADLMLNTGRPGVARQTLFAVRNNLYKLRKSAGIVVLADCINDANKAMDALMAYNRRKVDWSNAATRDDITKKATVYDEILTRCDSIAKEEVRRAPEFRRLIDTAKTSLGLMPKAVETRDSGLLHRLLIELRSLDNLLAFRYG